MICDKLYRNFKNVFRFLSQMHIKFLKRKVENRNEHFYGLHLEFLIEEFSLSCYNGKEIDILICAEDFIPLRLLEIC